MLLQRKVKHEAKIQVITLLYASVSQDLGGDRRVRSSRSPQPHSEFEAISKQHVQKGFLLEELLEGTLGKEKA